MPSPTYQRIADDLRRSILDGTLPPGARLPSRHDLARQYQVSDRVGLEAVRLLIAEGFAEARSGSGSYVRHRPEMQRMTRSWYTSRAGGSPFRAAMNAAGRPGTWESSTERAPMTPAVAERLGALEGDPAMRTRYTYLADGEPVMLAESWESAGLTPGQAKAEAYRAGVESLGAQGYTVMQLMQIVGERNVRIVPDVAVTGQNGSAGLVDGLLGVMLRQNNGTQTPKQN